MAKALPTIRRRAALGMALAAPMLATRHGLAQGLKKVTYAVATADLNVGYPFATLPITLGYYKDEGLDVSVVPGQSSAAVIQLLLTGRADIVVGQPDPVVIQRVKNNLPILSIYALCRRSTNRITVLPDSPIQSARDLKGKKIGIVDLGSGGAFFLRAQLNQVGLSIKDVQLIQTGYGSPAFEALKSGAIDANLNFTGGIVRQQVAGYAVRTLHYPGEDEEFYSYNLFATEATIKDNSDVIRKMSRATARATVFMMTNPEASVRLFWKQYPDRAPKDLNDPASMQRDLAILKGQLRDMACDTLPVSTKWGEHSPAVFDVIQANLKDGGQIDTTLPGAAFYTNIGIDYGNDFDRAPIVAQAKAAG